MSYLLDTNSVSYLMEKRPTIVTRVAEAGGVSNLAIATITLAELRYGVEILPESRRKRKRLASLDTVLKSIEAQPFTEDAAAMFGWAGSRLRSAGVAFSFPDLAIASVALAEDRTVASNDRFFRNAARVCGLKFELWTP